MKARQVFALAGISMLAMSNSCEKQSDAIPLTTGRLVKTETTLDIHFANPRPRWVVDIAPLSLPGWKGNSYQQVKVFNLLDTVEYKPGRIVAFHYQLIPYDQQTPWRTWVEQHNIRASAE
jgi:hypothetical protein